MGQGRFSICGLSHEFWYSVPTLLDVFVSYGFDENYKHKYCWSFSLCFRELFGVSFCIQIFVSTSVFLSLSAVFLNSSNSFWCRSKFFDTWRSDTFRKLYFIISLHNYSLGLWRMYFIAATRKASLKQKVCSVRQKHHPNFKKEALWKAKFSYNFFRHVYCFISRWTHFLTKPRHSNVGNSSELLRNHEKNLRKACLCSMNSLKRIDVDSSKRLIFWTPDAYVRKNDFVVLCNVHITCLTQGKNDIFRKNIKSAGLSKSSGCSVLTLFMLMKQQRM